jgi:hypothetical protein
MKISSEDDLNVHSYLTILSGIDVGRNARSFLKISQSHKMSKNGPKISSICHEIGDLPNFFGHD